MVQTEDNANGSISNLEPEQFRKLFIGGLTSTTTDENLREYYSKWGEIVDCVIMRDPSSKRSRGFGFVSYAKQSEVDEAMANRPHTIDGKTVDPKRAVPREQSQKSEANLSSKRLYVSGVREDHTEEMFRNYFGKYGTILKCEIITDKATGKPRGFAFISFDDYDAVDKCVLIKSHMINNARCDVKKALSKEEMAKERERMDRGSRSRGPPVGGRGSGWGMGGGERGGYGAQAWGGPGGYAGGAAAGQWGPPGAARGGYYDTAGGGGGGYGAGGYSGGGYGAAAAPAAGGWGQGGWSQGGQGGGPSWGGGSSGSSGGGGWGSRGY